MATAYERVRIARGAKRPTGIDYLQNVFHGFFELHGDRRYADDPAIVGGLAYLGATPVTVIAIEKGHTAKERVQRGFGAPQPEGYRKALRLMREAEKFHRPVVCFVDTSGAGCNVGAEERGQGEAIAECLTTMSALQTPVLSILIGEGGSGGALALAAGDRVWMLENAVYSVISPGGLRHDPLEGCRQSRTGRRELEADGGRPRSRAWRSRIGHSRSGTRRAGVL